MVSHSDDISSRNLLELQSCVALKSIFSPTELNSLNLLFTFIQCLKLINLSFYSLQFDGVNKYSTMDMPKVCIIEFLDVFRSSL